MILCKIKFVSLLVLAMVLLFTTAAFGAVDLKEVVASLNKPWKGDFEQLVQKRAIRVLIPYSKTFYFLDKASQRGASYEMVKLFEKSINSELKTRHLKIQFVFIPTPREKLIQALAKGFGDIAVGNLTVTDKRMKQVDFSDPFSTDVNEILVTGPQSPSVKGFSDLSGQEIHVRKSSSYYESLEQANKKLAAAKKAGIKIVTVDENLEDEDLLEMLNAGMIPMMIIDSHKGEFWATIFDNITLHHDITFRENSKIAWAIQKNTPGLKKKINAFVKKNKKGTLMGNVIFNRYLKDTRYVNNNLGDKARKRFEETVRFFQKYAKQYKFDWLMLAALAYQESGLDQSKVSHTGAIGVMQVLPSTARDKNINIPNIKEIGPNIHAGTKYLRFILNRYFSAPDIGKLDRVLLTFAAYNAGPARVTKLRSEAKSMNLDPNVWFNNVEVVAARRIGRETVQYVSNIFKYYIAYTYSMDQLKAKAETKK
jgi:membrane-bound lytic murein transglycosylase MltF